MKGRLRRSSLSKSGIASCFAQRRGGFEDVTLYSGSVETKGDRPMGGCRICGHRRFFRLAAHLSLGSNPWRCQSCWRVVGDVPVEVWPPGLPLDPSRWASALRPAETASPDPDPDPDPELVDHEPQPAAPAAPSEGDQSMPITAHDPGGSERELIPPGWHIGRCIGVYDLGWQISRWNEQHKVGLQFEIPALRREDGPATIMAFYRLSLHEKANLRADLERWRTRPFTAEELAGFDVTKVAGAPAALLVKHVQRQDGSYNDEIDVIAAPQPGSQIPPQITPITIIDHDAPDLQQRLSGLSDGLRQMIERGIRNLAERRAREAQGAHGGHQGGYGGPPPQGGYGGHGGSQPPQQHQQPPQGQPPAQGGYAGQNGGQPPQGAQGGPQDRRFHDPAHQAAYDAQRPQDGPPPAQGDPGAQGGGYAGRGRDDLDDEIPF